MANLIFFIIRSPINHKFGKFAGLYATRHISWKLPQTFDAGFNPGELDLKAHVEVLEKNKRCEHVNHNSKNLCQLNCEVISIFVLILLLFEILKP